MPRVKKPVWYGDWPIPKKIELPGVTIRIKLLNAKDCEAMGAGYGVWMYKPPITDPNPDAVIYINSDIPIAAQRYVLVHELQHAVMELVDVMLEKFPENVMTGFMVAMAQGKATLSVPDVDRVVLPANRAERSVHTRKPSPEHGEGERHSGGEA